MPMAAPRPCSKPGCRALTRGGAPRCELHAEPSRSGSRDPFYNTGRWRAARRCYLVKHPTCAACGAPASVVDHVVPRQLRPDLEWESGNWQALCHPCHARKGAAGDGWLGNPRRAG